MRTGACLLQADSPAATTRNSGITTSLTAIWEVRAPAVWVTAHRHRAARGRNRIVVNIQTDGDLNYAPGVLWTAVHHKLPLLTVMHNNRAWHQEFMFIEYMAGVRGRGADRAHIGSTLRDPFLDYAKMAAGYGMAPGRAITPPP